MSLLCTAMILHNFVEGSKFLWLPVSFPVKRNPTKTWTIPRGANSFLLELTSFCQGGENETDRVASPKNVPIHLNKDVE